MGQGFRIDTIMTKEFDSEGAVLSGGEQQKIVVARALAQNASVKVLDKPSSALDPIAKYHLNHSMLTAAENKSVVFISHRLSTTRIADRIFMLEQGKIIEEGSHLELLECNGKYAQMWKVQAGQHGWSSESNCQLILVALLCYFYFLICNIFLR